MAYGVAEYGRRGFITSSTGGIRTQTFLIMRHVVLQPLPVRTMFCFTSVIEREPVGCSTWLSKMLEPMVVSSIVDEFLLHCLFLSSFHPFGLMMFNIGGCFVLDDFQRRESKPNFSSAAEGSSWPSVTWCEGPNELGCSADICYQCEQLVVLKFLHRDELALG